MKVLVSSPESDNITRYLHAWSKKMVEDFANKHDFVHLEGEHANRDHFCGLLRKDYPEIVLINGHGGDDMIAGHNQEILIDATNVSLLKGKIVHALSCSTAKVLGELAVAAGAKGYIGYDASFVLISRQGALSNPLGDDLAQLFLEPAFAAPRGLLSGKAVRESAGSARDAYKRSIKSALNSDVQSDQEQCVPYLLHNLNHIRDFE